MLNSIIIHILPFIPKKLVWVFSKRYIAGETIDDGIRVCKELNARGILVTVDLLGEFISNFKQAEEYKNKYIEIINRFTTEQISGNFSLKPSMFGLLIDESTCYKDLREIVSLAASKDNFIRIDMEDSKCVDAELRLYTKLRDEFPRQVGIVFQSYLLRTKNDLEKLSKLSTTENQLNIRLCKGIYIEPEEIAYKVYQEIREHFLDDLEFCFKNHIYTGIATHDKYLIDGALKLIVKHQVPKTEYEFQMLYGVTPELRKSLVEQGHKMRVYVPFGKEWFGYSTRRLKENPKIATHIIKALFVSK